MKPASLSQNRWLVLLIIFLVLQAGAVGYLLLRVHSLSSNATASQHTASQLSQKLDANTLLLTDDVNAEFAAEKVVVDPIGSVVYIPEFRIKLPLNSTTKTIAYSLRTDLQGNETQEADVTSTKYVAPPQPTVVNCSDLLRLKIESKPNPYSPNEQTTSVTLGNGQTLQVYALINEKECTNSWKGTISPNTLAQEFKNAQSY